jgi:hypothetical protein
MVGGRRECDQDRGLAEARIDGNEALDRDDQVGGGAAEQAADLTETAGARHEHGLADAAPARRTGLDDRAD